MVMKQVNCIVFSILVRRAVPKTGSGGPLDQKEDVPRYS